MADLWDWISFALTDPRAVGAVGWISLLITVAGFTVAIAQIAKIRSVSQAAKEASLAAINVVRSQEQSGRLSIVVTRLNSAKSLIKAENVRAAAAHLELAWVILIDVRELTSDGADKGSIQEHLTSIRSTYDEIDALRQIDVPDEETHRRWYVSISNSLVEIETISARNRMKLSGIGS